MSPVIQKMLKLEFVVNKSGRIVTVDVAQSVMFEPLVPGGRVSISFSARLPRH